MAALGKIYCGQAGGLRVLRLVGEIRHPLGGALERFIDASFKDGAPEGFVIDMRGADVIDSTSLGLIASIANRMRGEAGRRVTLVSDREDLCDLLMGMGFDTVFDIVAGSAIAPALWQELEAPAWGPEDTGSLVLRAHRMLMAVDPRNEEGFRDLVRLLEERLRHRPR